MTRDECLDGAAQAYVDAVAERDAMTPEQAAHAALPTGTPQELEALALEIRISRRTAA